MYVVDGSVGPSILSFSLYRPSPSLMPSLMMMSA
jgi:hypothetical protein